MKRIIYKSDNGYEMEFRQEKHLPKRTENHFEVMDGNTVSGVANTIKIPNRDGERTYGLTRSKRDVNVKAAVVVYGNTNKSVSQALSETKNLICCTFDPKYFGTLYYYAYDDDKGKKIRCRPTGLPAFEPHFSNLIKFSVGLVSDSSTWVMIQPEHTALGITEPLWEFPYYIFPDETNFAFIYNQASITNPTNYIMYPVLTVYDSDIAVEVTNITTNKTLKFNRAVGANQRLIIDVFEITAVLQEKQSDEWVYVDEVMRYLDMDSTVSEFYLIPGYNEFVVKSFGTQKPVLEVDANIPVMGV